MLPSAFLLVLLLSFQGAILFVAGGHPNAESGPSSNPKPDNRIIAKIGGELTIRMAEKEDANEKLRELYKLLAEHLAMVTKDEEVGEIKLSNEQIGGHLERKLMECFVAEVKGEFAGYAIYYFGASSTEGRIMHLEDFFVKEEYRHRDLALADGLFRELARKAWEHNVESIEWTVPGENVGAVKFYNKQPKIVNLTAKKGIEYWRFLIEKSKEAVEKKAEEIKGGNNLRVKVTSIGNSCKKDEADKKEKKTEEGKAGKLARQWESILAKSAGKRHEGQKMMGTSKLAELLKVNGQNGEHRSLGSVTVLAGEGGPMVGMALFHCNAYSSWTGPYIWMDNLAVDDPRHLEEAGTLIFGELAKIGANLGAERIEWMAPEGGGNDQPSPNAFVGNVEFFQKIGSINLTEPQNGHWVLYRWPREGFEEKIGKNGKEELKMEKLRILEGKGGKEVKGRR